MAAKDGQPVECFLPPGSYRDGRALKSFQVDVPAGSRMDADRASNGDALEEVLLEAAHVQRGPLRNKHSPRTPPPYIASVQHDHRTMIGTVGSLLERMRPNTMPAVTAAGFALKVFLCVLA
jgi:hypothetical protein